MSMLNGNSVNINGNENVSSTLPGTPLTRKKSQITDFFSTSNLAGLLGWFAVGGLKMDLNNSHSIHPSILFLFHSAGVHSTFRAGLGNILSYLIFCISECNTVPFKFHVRVILSIQINDISYQNNTFYCHIRLIIFPIRGFSSRFRGGRSSLPCVFRLQPSAENEIKYL